MALARFKDLCIDAQDVRRSAAFWASALGLVLAGDDAALRLVGDQPEQTVWINAVPELKTVKNRVHLDVHVASIADLTAVGATVAASQPVPDRWTVLIDPDGQELCAFVRRGPPAYRLYEVIVDCADPERLAHWWADVFGVDVRYEGPAAASGAGPDQAEAEWWVEPPGAPFDALIFAAVPEPKSGKNRVHWDVTGLEAGLRAAGATVLRPRDDEVSWTVLADPEGNEFCVFAPLTG
jgi:catechol 2,3-dioxygenase-like lactoylglutathione lyase family enzyme